MPPAPDEPVPPSPVALSDAAAELARQGLQVFPLHTPRPAHGGLVCSCSDGPGCHSPGKHPRITRGLHQATTDPEQIRSWWRQWPNANIGVRTGGDLLVLDLDTTDAAGLLDQLGQDLGPLPATLTVATPRGEHRYYQVPADSDLRNSVSRLAPGVDVRANGGYVVAPPSLHETGRRYEWADPHPPAPLPARWIDTITNLSRPPAPVGPAPTRTLPSIDGEPTRERRYGVAALIRESDAVAEAVEGTRNDRLHLAAYNLGRLVAVCDLDLDEITVALTDAAAAAGLGDNEAARTITSGLSAGQLDPRGLPPLKRQARPSDKPISPTIGPLNRHGDAGWTWTTRASDGRTIGWRTGTDGTGLHRNAGDGWNQVRDGRFTMPAERPAAIRTLYRLHPPDKPTPARRTPPTNLRII